MEDTEKKSSDEEDPEKKSYEEDTEKKSPPMRRTDTNYCLLKALNSLDFLGLIGGHGGQNT